MNSRSDSAEAWPIHAIVERLGLADHHVEYRGDFAAKLQLSLLDRYATKAQGKLILVTAVTPTRHGEGKTVVSIGLTQALHRMNRTAIVTLREPSLGPFLGQKGAGTGGGRSQVIPSAMINLHFTGDSHAVTVAHNLLAAMIDSHLYHSNPLGIDANNIFWPRATEINDRALRCIAVGLREKPNGEPRETGFVITAASEVMAVLALAESRVDLRRRLDNIVAALAHDGRALRPGDFGCTGAMMALLNEAVLPNLVQTTEHCPAFVHTGPFANIAHGTSSVIAQKMALGLAEFVINEVGFSTDLGAEKYFDIVMPSSGLKPAAAVLVASARALREQASPGDPRGLANLERHLGNLRKFGVATVVALNLFEDDAPGDIDGIRSFCGEHGVACAITDPYRSGGEGALDLAALVIDATSGKIADARPLYSPSISTAEKVEIVAREIYGASGVHFDPGALRQVQKFEALGYGQLPVCVAKTQASLTDNPKLKGAPQGWTLKISNASLAAGAGFIVAVAGNMVLLPGLGQEPRAVHMDVDDAGKIVERS